MLRYVMIVVAAAGMGIGAAYLKSGGYVDAALETASASVNGSFETTAALDEQPDADAQAAEPLTLEQALDKKIAEAEAETEALQKTAESCANAPGLVKVACALKMQKQIQKSIEATGAVEDMVNKLEVPSERE